MGVTSMDLVGNSLSKPHSLLSPDPGAETGVLPDHGMQRSPLEKSFRNSSFTQAFGASPAANST